MLRKAQNQLIILRINYEDVHLPHSTTIYPGCIGMNVGVCRIELRLPENLSLKGKRRVLKSITSRVRNRFNVSIAEVDDQNLWQLATLGICCVSNNSRYTNEVLSKVVDFIVDSRFEVEILNYEIELLPVL